MIWVWVIWAKLHPPVLGCAAAYTGWSAPATRESLLHGCDVPHGSGGHSCQRSHHLHSGGESFGIQGEVSFHLFSLPLFPKKSCNILSKQHKFFVSIFLSICCCVEDRQSTKVPTSLCLHLQGETRTSHWLRSWLHWRKSGHSLCQPSKPVSLFITTSHSNMTPCCRNYLSQTSNLFSVKLFSCCCRAKDNFTFKCHRSPVTGPGQTQDIFAVSCYGDNIRSITSLLHLQVNCIAFHPVHNTLATVGSDGKYSFWDKDARTKLKTSEAMEQPISSCAFNFNGNIFAYSVSYDWSKVSIWLRLWKNLGHIWMVCYIQWNLWIKDTLGRV